MKNALPRIVLLFFAIFLSACSSFLYYPTRTLYVDPAKLKPIPLDVSFKIQDKIDVKGWHFVSSTNLTKTCVLFFHGNGQNRSIQFQSLFWLVEAGFDLYIFDYPGYGQTGGQPTPESTVKMASGALGYVKGSKVCNKIAVYGHSLGGQIAMRMLWELRRSFSPDLLIVDSSFLSYQTVGRKVLAKSPWTWVLQPASYLLLSDRWAIDDKLPDLRGLPILVIHTRTDEIIPFELGEEVFSSAKEPKEFWIKESGSHNAIYLDDEGQILRRRLIQRLKKL